MERRERGKKMEEEEAEKDKEREKVRGAGTQFHELWKMEKKEGMREKWMKKTPKRPSLVSKQKIPGQGYHGRIRLCPPYRLVVTCLLKREKYHCQVSNL